MRSRAGTLYRTVSAFVSLGQAIQLVSDLVDESDGQELPGFEADRLEEIAKQIRAKIKGTKTK